MAARIGHVRAPQAATLLVLLSSIFAYVSGQSTCTEAQANDALIGQTQLFGNKNISDSIWQDQLHFFRRYGPITKITAYKATEYDNLWHDPGELKGFQFWYGPEQLPAIYKYEDGDENLFGARKPHIPGDLVLAPGEKIVRVELQWDPISMRGVRFWTNTGRLWEWGFLNIPGATKAIATAPLNGAYLAAMRGFEGKPRAGIAKKRYLIQIALVWALPTCQQPDAPPATPAQLPPSRSTIGNRRATSLYLLDPETVSLIPPQVQASNIVYDGVIVRPPPPNEGLEFMINATHMIGIRVNRPTQPIGTPTVPTRPVPPPAVVQESDVKPASRALPTTVQQAAPQPAPVQVPVPQTVPSQVPVQQPVRQRVPPPVRAIPQRAVPSSSPQPCYGFLCFLFSGSN